MSPGENFEPRPLCRRPTPVAALAMLLAVVACERPPISPEVDVPDGDLQIAIETFINDRYSLGSKWYLYENHIITPKPEVYLVADRDAVPEQYYAFELASFHDANTGASGNFTIDVVHWQGGSWGSAMPLALSHTVYDGEPPMCVELFGPSEVACSGNDWHISFQAFAYLAPISVFPVGSNPGMLVRSTAGQADRGGVHLAVVDAVDLTALALDPTTVADLPELPPQTFGSTEYDHTAWKPNLPQQGMVIGRTWIDGSGAATGGIYFLRTFDRKIIKFRIDVGSPGAPPGGVSLHYQRVDDGEDAVAELEAAAAVDAPVSLPAAYGVAFVDFSADPAQVDLAADLLYDPPNHRDWDLGFEVTAEGVQVLVSPGAIIWDWTHDPDGGNGSTDFDAAVPPIH